MSRTLLENEREVVAALLSAAGLPDDDLETIIVDVINADTGTIRAKRTAEGEKTKAVSDCNFDDADGTYVEAILFVDINGNFGELFIWKVDDTPLMRFPASLAEIRQIRRISKSSNGGP